MSIIQLITLPDAMVQPRDRRRKLVPLAPVVHQLVDDLPDLIGKSAYALGLDPMTCGEGLVDVEHRESGYTKNPADLRIIGMFREEHPGTLERNEIDHVWHEMVNDWFWDTARYYPPDIIDPKLIFGC